MAKTFKEYITESFSSLFFALFFFYVAKLFEVETPTLKANWLDLRQRRRHHVSDMVAP